MRFRDKVAIVTGSGRGIGRATILAFAREGARVVINDVDGDCARDVLGEVQAAGGQGIAALGNVADPAATRRIVADAVAAFGTVDILVNNAGIIAPAKIVDTTEEQWDQVIGVGLKGTFNCLQVVGPIFLGYSAQPEDIAPSILFLASPDADYITGHVLNVSGGMHIGV